MYLCAVFQEVVIAGLQPCVTKLELKGTLITHDAGCVLIASLTILVACGRTDPRRGSGGTHWDDLTSELTRRSVRLLAGDFGLWSTQRAHRLHFREQRTHSPNHSR